MITLPINLRQVGFVEREKKNEKYIKNRCGRDFLYYSLDYYHPEEFNSAHNNPEEIERKRSFGLSIPAMFAWTQFQFFKLPKFLKTKSLLLKINDRKVNTFFDFFNAILFSRIEYRDAVRKIEKGIEGGRAVGLDISMAFNGLLDHMLFVYGFDDDFYYVFDTRKVPLIKYEKVDKTSDVYYMKISKSEVKKRWKRFSRVWEMERF